MPMPIPSITDSLPLSFDREQAFLLYAAFAGDLERTAHALNIRPEQVLAIVEEGNWNARLKPIIELRKSTRPGDFERGINRALNFIQAHKYRLFLERLIFRITNMTAQEFEDYFLQPEKMTADGKTVAAKLSTRALADLASAMEKAHAMSYHALNDTAAERVKRKEDDDGMSAADLHVKLAKAMQEVGADKTIRAKLFDAQIATAQSLVNEKKDPTPYDQ